MMIRREITTRIKSILIWSAAFAFFIIGGMTEFDIFAEGGGQQLNQFVQAMPRIMRVIYGMEGVDISSFEGYFSILLLYVLIMVAVHGAFLGCALIHLEFKERTADFLFVKPMSRSRILLHKLVGGLSVILILQAVIAASSFYVFSSTGNLGFLPRTLLATLLTHIFFFALGFLLTILLPKSRTGQHASLVYVIVSYFSISLSQLYDISWLTAISPVGWYYAWTYKADAGSYWLTAGIFIVLTLLFIGVAVRRFESKDIPS